MRLVTLKKNDLQKYTIDPEMLQKAGRPCVLIVKLKYKGKRIDFAVPIRSNIHPSTPKDQYFPLPPRTTTKPKHRHGIHYIKMFPVDKSIVLRYRTSKNPNARLMKKVIDQNEKQIVLECQQYLTLYECGIRPQYSTDIDLLIKNCL